jgi:hypothetical protein
MGPYNAGLYSLPCGPTMPEPNRPRFGRIVRRHRPADGRRGQPSLFSLRPAELWRMLKSYMGFEGNSRTRSISDPAALADFLETRASFMAQASLYGYLRTRAGMRYPELFDDDPFVAAINIAKWHVWLACLSDIATYSGSRLARHAPRQAGQVGELMSTLVDGILESTGEPDEAGGEFAAHAQRVRERVARSDWLAVGDDEDAFTESPGALVRWAPIVDELKELDEEIVRNSVRYRWQEVRRDFNRDLDAAAVLEAATTAPALE